MHHHGRDKSTIPGAGLGTFSGIDRKPDDVISQGYVMVLTFGFM